jgi:hypothetical protein
MCNGRNWWCLLGGATRDVDGIGAMQHQRLMYTNTKLWFFILVFPTKFNQDFNHNE